MVVTSIPAKFTECNKGVTSFHILRYYIVKKDINTLTNNFMFVFFSFFENEIPSTRKLLHKT